MPAERTLTVGGDADLVPARAEARAMASSSSGVSPGAAELT